MLMSPSFFFFHLFVFFFILFSLLYLSTIPSPLLPFTINITIKKYYFFLHFVVVMIRFRIFTRNRLCGSQNRTIDTQTTIQFPTQSCPNIRSRYPNGGVSVSPSVCKVLMLLQQTFRLENDQHKPIMTWFECHSPVF